jgi:uncharacterized protein (DUF1697 family)
MTGPGSGKRGARRLELMRYVAFLRAINVGGHTVRMEELRRLFESMGAVNVQSFIASGNVIFDSDVTSEADLERRIEAGLEKALKFPVTTFLRTLPEVAAAAGCPAFPAEEVAAAPASYVGFLKSPPPKAVCAAVAAASTATHRFKVHGREMYWLRLDLAEALAAAPKLDKQLGPTTVRNVTTLRKIAAKYGAAPVGKKPSPSAKRSAR